MDIKRNYFYLPLSSSFVPHSGSLRAPRFARRGDKWSGAINGGNGEPRNEERTEWAEVIWTAGNDLSPHSFTRPQWFSSHSPRHHSSTHPPSCGASNGSVFGGRKWNLTIVIVMILVRYWIKYNSCVSKMLKHSTKYMFESVDFKIRIAIVGSIVDNSLYNNM